MTPRPWPCLAVLVTLAGPLAAQTTPPLDSTLLAAFRWLDALGSVVDDPRYGLASCGARYVDPGGRPAGGDVPHDLGPVFDGTPPPHQAFCNLGS